MFEEAQHHKKIKEKIGLLKIVKEDYDDADLDKKRPGVRKTGTKCCLAGRVLTLASSKHLRKSATSVNSYYSCNHRAF